MKEWINEYLEIRQKEPDMIIVRGAIEELSAFVELAGKDIEWETAVWSIGVKVKAERNKE